MVGRFIRLLIKILPTFLKHYHEIYPFIIKNDFILDVNNFFDLNLFIELYRNRL